jgi:hypothetical protein
MWKTGLGGTWFFVCSLVCSIPEEFLKYKKTLDLCLIKFK